jgi:arylsulfatase
MPNHDVSRLFAVLLSIIAPAACGASKLIPAGAGGGAGTGGGAGGAAGADAPEGAAGGIAGAAGGATGIAGGAAGAAGGAAGAAVVRRDRPNVIIILADDQGWADVGVYGAQGLTTPNLDRLAADGIRFTSFYAAGAICSPSRAALMTGTHPVRVGITEVLYPSSPIGLNRLEVTIADLLKSCGYATAAVGKWHLGDDKTFLPTRQGFDEYFGLPYSNDMHPLPLLENEDAIEESPDQSQLTKRYTERALDFIKRNKQDPFFLYLAHTMPHVPLAASDDFKGKSARGLYGDAVMEVDWSVGQVMATLDQLGIADNTLVLYTSDNGPSLTYGDHAGSAGPLREGKWTTFEGGMRVPGIMRWPDRIPRNTVSRDVVSGMDLFPTIAAITGTDLPPVTIDGRNILPLLEGSAPATTGPTGTMYYYLGTEQQAVRDGRWKLHLPHSYRTIIQPGVNGNGGQEEVRNLPLSLFDVDADPGETTDLAAQFPDVVTEMMAAAAAFDEDLKHNLRPPGQLP